MKEFGWDSRRSVRVLVEAQAAVRLHRTSKREIHLKVKTVSAKLLDISGGGCALESASLLPAGAKLNIFLDKNQLAGTSGQKGRRSLIKIVGVVRSGAQFSSRAYRIGVRFEKISPADVKLIREFIGRNDRREEKRSRPLD